jgi:hypothetical protein
MTTLAAAFLFARFTVLAPADGQAKEFEAGYRRHLAWHDAAGDPCPWHGWTIVTGTRPGVFVDATVGRTAREIDEPVAPAEDAADFAKNVRPHARLVSNVVYRHRPDLCGDPSPAADAPFSSLVTIVVEAERVREFESALARAKLHGACLELASGGAAPSYLLLRPASKLTEALGTGLPSLEGVESATVEAVRYRPELSSPKPPAPAPAR